MTNPSINSTFLEDTTVLVNKDYTRLDPHWNKYLTKNAVGGIIECGLSKYEYDPETKKYTKLVDGEKIRSGVFWN